MNSGLGHRSIKESLRNGQYQVFIFLRIPGNKKMHKIRIHQNEKNVPAHAQNSRSKWARNTGFNGISIMGELTIKKHQGITGFIRYVDREFSSL